LYGQCGTTGATTQLIYAPFLWKPDSYYSDYFYEVYVYAGVNIGVTKRATAWTLSSFLLQVHSVYTVACDATSYIELHHIFTVDELNKAINQAIETTADNYYIPTVDTTTIRLQTTKDNLSVYLPSYTYTMPANMEWLNTVITENTTAGVKLTGTVSGAFTLGEKVTGGTSGATGELAWVSSTYIRLRKVSGTFVTGETATGGTSGETCTTITSVEYETAGMYRWLPEDAIDRRSWDIVQQYPTSTSQLRLDKRYYSIIPDLYLQLEGERRHPTLSSDTGICYLPLDWVVQKAITALPQNKIESNQLSETYRRALALSAQIPTRAPSSFSRRVVT